MHVSWPKTNCGTCFPGTNHPVSLCPTEIQLNPSITSYISAHMQTSDGYCRPDNHNDGVDRVISHVLPSNNTERQKPKRLSFSPTIRYLHLTPQFHQNLWHKETRIPELICSVVCVISCLAVSIQYRQACDRQTDTTRDRLRQLIPR